MTSKLCPPTQLKKGNKEPNPMVQLSVQDVTQESKVRVTTSLVGAKRAQDGCEFRVSIRMGMVLGTCSVLSPLRLPTVLTAQCGKRLSDFSCKTLEARSLMCR